MWGLEDNDAALKWIEKGIEQKSYRIPSIIVDSKFDKLRSDSRFIALVKKIGLQV